jgi:2-C-methyl-D-erythritol 4-phosphate cytidylyltransferase
MKKTVAIILAAGSGKRMQSNTAKQYLLIKDKPVLYYALKAFEESEVNEIILVVGKNHIEFCKNAIIDKYKIKKVIKIIEGGSERYHSVYCGLQEIADTDNVLIHDGARPFISVDIINNTILELENHNACVVGVPSKDTVKIVDMNGIVVETPNRDMVWSVQTPQGFSFEIIMNAYSMIMDKLSHNSDGLKANIPITDDAMVVEQTINCPIKMIMGSYRNIKITTPEDILIGEEFVKS